MKNNTKILKSYDCSNTLPISVHKVKGTSPYCSAVHDGILCWPETQPGITVAQHCPALPGFHTEMLVYRKCNENGHWHHFNESFVVIEKTNYESCLHQIDTIPPEYGPQYLSQITNVIQKTNILGVIFVLLSLLSISISIILYKYILPKYVNDILQIKIHKQLFGAVTVDMLLKFIFQISVLLTINNLNIGFLQKPTFCEVLITMHQYSEIAVLLWMVLDSHFIHTSTKSGFLCISGYLTYIIIGWGIPLIPALVWAMTLAMSHKVSCWQGHMNLPSIWMVEIPKIVCFVSIVILLCISSFKHYQKVTQRVQHNPKTISDITTTGIIFSFMLAAFLLTIIPTHMPIGDLQRRVVVQYISTIMTSSKGVYVTLLCNYSNIKGYVRLEISNAEITEVEMS